MFFNIPWWILVIAVFIFLSGYMAYRAIRAEKQLEQQFIEREGAVYVERMHSEKKQRGQSIS